MSLTSRLFPRFWMIVPLCALGCLMWMTQRRVERLEYVSNLAQTPSNHAPFDPQTGPLRTLIVPERNEATFEWIMQTEQMVSGRTLRVRLANYDHAPEGRAVWATSPYRWW